MCGFLLCRRFLDAQRLTRTAGFAQARRARDGHARSSMADTVAVRVPKIILHEATAKPDRAGRGAHRECAEREAPSLSVDGPRADATHHLGDYTGRDQLVV